MKAIILAAGQGKRFSYHEAKKPKCLMEIGDTTLLNIQIDTLHQCGIDNIIIVRGYQKSQIDVPGITYYDNDKFDQTNVLYSLFVAREELKDDVLVLYSDIYYEENLLRKIIASTHDISLGSLINFQDMHKLKSDLSTEDIELIDFTDNFSIKNIGKQMRHDPSLANGQFIGIFKLTPIGCSRIKKFYDYYKLKVTQESDHNYKQAWITDLFSEMIGLGSEIKTIIADHGWFEVNTFDDYKNLLKIESLKNKHLLVKTDWKSRAKAYNKLDWVNNDTLLKEMIAQVDNVNEQTKMLDIGTGTGKILIGFQLLKGPAQYQGCDISPSMMEKIDPAHNFELAVTDVTDLSIYPDDYFDVITARMVFHHVNQLNKAMQECYKKLRAGGILIICEGNPPSYRSFDFYKEMFFYKEDRNVFMESDIINLFAHNGFKNITTKTIITENMSLNNWIDNSGLPQRNIDIVKSLHYNCEEGVKDDYNMQIKEEDITMDWKFSIVTGKR